MNEPRASHIACCRKAGYVARDPSAQSDDDVVSIEFAFRYEFKDVLKRGKPFVFLSGFKCAGGHRVARCFQAGAYRFGIERPDV